MAVVAEIVTAADVAMELQDQEYMKTRGRDIEVV